VKILRTAGIRKWFMAAQALIASTSAFGSAIDVRVLEERQADRVHCQYTVVNPSNQPILAFALGGNENLAGPYELANAPEGWYRDAERPDGKASPAPSGWESSLLTEEGALNFAVEWQTKNYEKAIMPGTTYEGFDLAFSQASAHCKGVHWTAITRDSQIISGVLK
jgi:hypothetical protein